MPTISEPALTAEELQREIARLREEFEARVAELERRFAASPAKSAPPRKISDPLSPETVAIIAAAVTAFLGKKVKLRSARLIESGPSHWAQQGRAIIFASHNLVR